MSKQLHSALSIAILSVMGTSAFAETVVADTQNVFKLDTIVVTASGSEVNVKDAPASISVVQAKILNVPHLITYLKF